MKKVLSTMILTSTIVSASYASDWYIGVEAGSGSGERVYSDTNGDVEVNFDSSFAAFKIGKVSTKLDRTEVLFVSKTLENSKNSNDADDVNEIKINLAPSMYSIGYKDYFVPYFEVGIGFASSENYDGQLATHLGLGIVSKPMDNFLLNLGYRLSTNVGEVESTATEYSDQHGDVIFGASFVF